MDANKVRQLLKNEEGPKLDFKLKISISTESEKKELTKDVIAMANSRGGRGYIIYGVEDKTKRVVGIERPDFCEEQIQQIIYNRSDPPVPIAVDFIRYEAHELAVLTVFKSMHQPHQMMQNGAFYVRRGSTTDTARRNEIANLFQENGLMTYETVVLRHVPLTELDKNLMMRFFSAMNVQGETLNDILLEALGFIGSNNDGEDFHPTIGGLLLFGRNPSLYLPHVYIKVVQGDRVQCFYGNVLSMLDQVTDYIRQLLAEDDEAAGFPVGAVEEAIANAIAHRDYLDSSRGITVTITPKNIEVSNPGALIASNSVYRFIRENNPNRRNAWLYQRLLTLDEKRRFMKSGIGMRRMMKMFDDIGEVKFLNIGAQNLFKVIFPRGEKVKEVKLKNEKE